jgi:hypothetical protein
VLQAPVRRDAGGHTGDDPLESPHAFIGSVGELVEKVPRVTFGERLARSPVAGLAMAAVAVSPLAAR